MLIINSQGCEVLEQEKSSVFEQHLNPSEPPCATPERAGQGVTPPALGLRLALLSLWLLR